MSFTEWARLNSEHDSAAGDFARDWLESRSRSPRSFRALMLAVAETNLAACWPARKAASQLWNAYVDSCPALSRADRHEEDCCLVTWSGCQHSWDAECVDGCDLGLWDSCSCRFANETSE
jgi:hypothetical protein